MRQKLSSYRFDGFSAIVTLFKTYHRSQWMMDSREKKTFPVHSQKHTILDIEPNLVVFYGIYPSMKPFHSFTLKSGFAG